MIKIKESPEYKFFDIVEDLSIISFWYHSKWQQGTPWVMLYSSFRIKSNCWVMLCSHFAINDSLGLCYKPPSIPQRVTESRKVHIASHDGLPYFWTSNMLHISPRISQSGDRVAGICLSLIIGPVILSSNRCFIFWLESIHHINLCRKPPFPMKASLIFGLIVQATQSIIEKIFVDSVNLIVHTCDIKNKQIYNYLLLKKQWSYTSCNV